MTTTAIPFPPLPELRDHAPELARRLGMILLGLAGLVAWRFLKNPRLVGIIGPLWRRLTHVARRFEREAVRPATMRAARPGRSSGGTAPAARLPNGRGWLVRELGWEAAGYGSHLAHVLAEPEMQALIAAVPGVGRVLRPVCRMLGYDLAAVTLMVAPEMLVARIILPPAEVAVSAQDGGAELVGVFQDCLDVVTNA